MDDYPCFCTEINRYDELKICYVETDKKAYVYKEDKVFGSLKLNELEQKFIFAILSYNEDLLECRWVASETQMEKEQKYRVSVWIKDSNPSR